MQEWPPQEDGDNVSDKVEEKPESEPELNNRQEYILKKYNEEMDSDLPITEVAYRSIGGSLGIIRKLVENGADEDSLKDEIMSISRSKQDSELNSIEASEEQDKTRIDFDPEHLNLVDVKFKISNNHSLSEKYKNFKKIIKEETGSDKVRRADILNKFKEVFEDPRYEEGFEGVDYLDYLSFMSIIHSSVDYDSYEDEGMWKNEKLEKIDLMKVGATLMADEIKNDPLLRDYYDLAKKNLLEKTGRDTVHRRLIISTLADMLDDVEEGRTIREAKAAHRLREIYYKQVEIEQLNK